MALKSRTKASHPPVVLLVGFADSVHVARWARMLFGQGFRLVLLPVTRGYISPEFGKTTLVRDTADVARLGDHEVGVFDLDSPQLIAVARGRAEGRYLSGRVLSPAPRLFIGAVENPGAPPFEHRVPRAAKKADAGARFLQLQICFMPVQLRRRSLAATA